MKLLAAVAMFTVVATQAQANEDKMEINCPNLAGKYECTSVDKSRKKTRVEYQNEEQMILMYTSLNDGTEAMEVTPLVPDARPYELISTDEQKSVRQTGCQGNKIFSELTTVTKAAAEDPRYPAMVKISTACALDKKKSLLCEMVVQEMYQSGEVRASPVYKQACKRL